MDSSKRLRTGNGPAQSPLPELQALDQLKQKISACMRESGASIANGDQLDGLLAELLAVQQRLSGTAAEAILDEAMQDLLRKLEAATEELQAMVDRYTPPEGYRPPVAGDAAYVRDIVAYAHKLSYTTFAPAGFLPGQTVLRHFKPPAPQDLQLRSSRLHQFQRDYEARLQQAKQAAAVKQPAPVAAPAEAAATSIEDLLKQLPPMPPGWKPGDPIPTLGAPAAAAAAAASEPKPAAAVAQQPQALQPEPSSSEEEEEGEEGTAALPAGQRPQLISAFNLALNPEYKGYEIDYEASESSEEDSEEDSD